jgi:hypothetical protein
MDAGGLSIVVGKVADLSLFRTLLVMILKKSDGNLTNAYGMPNEQRNE